MCKRYVYSKAELPELQSGLAVKALLVMWFESSQNQRDMCCTTSPWIWCFFLAFWLRSCCPYSADFDTDQGQMGHKWYEKESLSFVMCHNAYKDFQWIQECHC